MMEESKKMVQDTSTRLEKAIQELVDLIVRPFPCLVAFFLRVGWGCTLTDTFV